jgi:trimeric autotransporter adhesin
MTGRYVMARRNGWLALILLVGVVTLVADAETGPLLVDTVQVTPDGILLEPGDTATLTAQAFDAVGSALPNARFTWSSSNAAVATVAGRGNLGLVTAVAPGTATIRATSEGVIGTAFVTVEQ